MTTTTINNRVNIERYALEDEMAEFCNIDNFNDDAVTILMTKICTRRRVRTIPEMGDDNTDDFNDDGPIM